MIASRLIQEEIMPLNITDTANEALNRMNEYKVSHFPVADNGHFVGVISEKDIYNHENLTRELQKEFIHFDNFYVYFINMDLFFIIIKNINILFLMTFI